MEKQRRDAVAAPAAPEATRDASTNEAQDNMRDFPVSS